MNRRKPPQDPIDFDIEPSLFPAEAAELIAHANQVWDQVAAVPLAEASFANAVLPILQEEDARSQREAWLDWLRSTTPIPAIRDASRAFHQAMTDANNQRFAREDVFRVVDVVWRNQDKQQPPLNAEHQLCLERVHHEFLEMGLGIEDETARARAGEIQAALAKLGQEYIKNLDSDASGIWLTMEELKGVSQQTLDRWRADGDGRRWVDRRMPNITAVTKSADSEETRRKAFLDFENRVAGKNEVILKEILLLRHELATILGLKNWAEYRESYRLVSTTEVLRFLQNVRDNLVDVGGRDVQALADMKQQHLIDQGIVVSEENKKLFLWDKLYYKERAMQSQFHVDTEKVAEYFPFTGCLHRLLALFEALFCLKIEPADVSTWHPDVHAFTVWNDDAQDSNTDFVGYMYLDPFPREHKYGHKGTICIRNTFVRPDGETRNHPVSVVVTNYTPPGPGRPSLLKPQETVSLFHELGHALHHLLARSAHRRTHGGTPRDFVEIPSIMLEHVFWSREVVRVISGHYENEEGEKLPDELLDGLLRSRWAYASFGELSNLMMALFDMKIHTPESLEEIRDMGLAVEFNKLCSAVGQVSGPEEQGWGWDGLKSYCRYRFPIGYAASYYAYVLSDAYSYDIFETKLRPHMPKNRAARVEDLVSTELRDEFKRYRRMILEPGSNVRSLNRLLSDYLGREPSSVPYLEMLKSSMKA